MAMSLDLSSLNTTNYSNVNMNGKNKLNDYSMINISTGNFRNEDYILKLNSMHMLKFFKDELTIKYIGKGYNLIDYAVISLFNLKTAQASKPVSANKSNPIFYFEVTIQDEGSKKDITIGFSDKEFVLNKQCGTTSKSYGYNSEGKIFHDKPKGESYGPRFKQKDVVGCGYYFSKNSIFFTLNGKFIGWAFKNVDTAVLSSYATVSLHSLNEKVSFNFGKNYFLFDIEGFYMGQMKENIKSISAMTVKENDLDYLVREYLVHSGYQESFVALEKDKEVPDLEMEEGDFVDNLRFCDTQRRDSLDEDMWRKYSVDEGMMNQPGVRKRTLSMMLDRMNDEREVPEKSSEDVFVIMNFLKERKVIHNMILERDYDLAAAYFESNFQPYRSRKELNWKRIILALNVLKFLERLRKDDYNEAFQIMNKVGKDYWTKDVFVLMYDSQKRVCDYTLESLSVLLCYENVVNSELNFLFCEEQISVICDQINSLILEFAGVSSESLLEKVLKQQTLVSQIFKEIKNSHGEKIKINI